jgi:hypothetical protein
LSRTENFDTPDGENGSSEQPPEEPKLVTVYSTLWFVGIELKPNQDGVVDLNLTDVIISFKDMSKYSFCLKIAYLK